ncbi:MAG TPA: GDP-mannose 4,6-dehydratase [Kiritimatiellia bacterium]|nr:GDP-mannose 4,6-dehydratase [Kiritimatiellia bacterium]
MKILVTGAGGLIGQCLSTRLREAGHKVHGLDVAGGEGILDADIMDADRLKSLFAEIRPDGIFHLAAQSSPPRSWSEPAETFRMNVNGTLHVLEAVRQACPGARVVVASSSAEYAMSLDGRPIRETYPLKPSNPYGISKMAAGELARVYGLRNDLQVLRVRPFFLIGPRKTGDVCSDFARGIVAVERGKQKELLTGNLEAVRDVMDVRDGAAAFQAVMEKGEPGEVYNICTGCGVRIGELLEMFVKLAKVPVAHRADPARMRAIDEPVRIGDPSRLKALGWAPACALQDTVRDILDYWRKREDEPCRS